METVETAGAVLDDNEVQARIFEMGDCAKVDKAQFDAYREAQSFYYGVQTDRWGSFLRRNHLMDQLLAEDAQGLR